MVQELSDLSDKTSILLPWKVKLYFARFNYYDLILVCEPLLFSFGWDHESSEARKNNCLWISELNYGIFNTVFCKLHAL